ncbi:MAG: EAL domain-containing protein [Ruminococcaceae bacterium]|nr:EAL domain-containing protein [Oscillospiraceae bacterium]
MLLAIIHHSTAINGGGGRMDQTGTNTQVRQKRTVLVVEDNEMNRELLCALLADDYTVLEAENGLVGLKQLNAHSGEIALIMLDVYMPECDGFEFLTRKREDPRFDTIPVIMMTASSTVDDEIRCLELGASDFITKPYNAEVMKNRMKGLIRLRESSAMLGQLEIDALTGLLSKEFFYHELEQALREDPDGRYDLVCSDVENFRAMNDRYGTEHCDRFLRALSEDYTRRLPGLLFGGRIGADVFAFLLPHMEDASETRLAPGGQDGRFGRFVVKTGLYADIDHSLAAAAICDRATLAISKIKKAFGSNFARYDDEMRADQLRSHQIEQTMEAALAERQFVVYYQPKHDLHTGLTGGAEALVRWISPEMGFVSPGRFIPLFERNGFITNLDFYIWEEVCRELRRCLDEGLPVVPVSVNVSRRDFESPELSRSIAELADRYGLDHALLHIELTESMYSDNPAQIAETLEALHADGFFIELDDFGAGYSSLTSLNTLTLDVMKIDMSLIRQATATNDYSILRFATLLADGMRLKTVVEGVETAEQVAALKVLGCDYIQGYFFSKPLPVQEYEEYLKAHCGAEVKA